MSLPDIKQIEAYIRKQAAAMGIDPEVAVRVAKSEGLAEGVWQSNVSKDGQQEQSYGPFQLYEGGGLGNKFKSMFGKSASDPSTWPQQVQFALGEAKKGGWGPWYGAKRVGIGNFEGIRPGASSPGPAPSIGPGVGLGSNASPEAAFNMPSMFANPSQGVGEAITPGSLDWLRGTGKGGQKRTDMISDFGASLSQNSAPPAARPSQSTRMQPVQIEGASYSKKQPQIDPYSLLRQLGLI
jgi:hypothetical protein